jgi:four helix bundle protein
MQNQSVNIKNQNLFKNSKIDVKYRAFYLSINVIRFLETLPKNDSFKVINNQLIRCTTSIGANIIEAKSSSSRREFLNYFQIALKSANESKYWLAILRELQPEYKEKLDNFLKETDEISRIVGTSVLTMKGKTKP